MDSVKSNASQDSVDKVARLIAKKIYKRMKLLLSTPSVEEGERKLNAL